MKRTIFTILIIILLFSFGIYKFNRHLESEQEWMKVHREYVKLSYEVESCIYLCGFNDELIPCFDKCDEIQERRLSEIGIMHDAWSEEYVN